MFVHDRDIGGWGEQAGYIKSGWKDLGAEGEQELVIQSPPDKR